MAEKYSRSQARFDTMIVGQISRDINVAFDGNTVVEYGGAVVYSGYAASSLGHRTAVVAKGNPEWMEPQARFAGQANLAVFAVYSPTMTSIRNVLTTADGDGRESWAISRIQPYHPDEMPDIATRIIHLAGLMNGDIEESFIPWAAQRAHCAVDVQGFMRHAQKGKMVYRDWDNKKTLLPHIHFLKTDAMEAKMLTGLDDRAQAARRLHEWGAQEVMVTHSSEVLVFDGSQIYRQPLRPRNISGRSGRGDTCFSAYITERLDQDIPQTLLTAAAVVSMKLENPGPFVGARQDVENYISQFYQQ